MNANSRSPWADWWRFMKSMSMDDHGRSRLNCVWRWTSGLRRSVSPAIHILAGEKVCIQAMTPMQSGAGVRVAEHPRDRLGVETTGFATTRTGTAAGSSRQAAMTRACSADPVEDRLAVEMLAPGDEPDLEVLQVRLHGRPSIRRLGWSFEGPLVNPDT